MNEGGMTDPWGRIDPKKLERARAVFRVIEQRALKGERAPQFGQWEYLTGMPGTERADLLLAKAGLIRIEVYALNWRVIEVLHGENAGKRTQECPRGGRPYFTSKPVAA